MPRFELDLSEPQDTRVEVVSVRREGAYVRLPEWCPNTLLLMEQKDYPPGSRTSLGVKHSPPACGLVYRVRAVMQPKPATLLDFRLDFRGEIPTPGPKALAPPGGIPGPGEEIPIFGSEKALHGLIQSAVCEKLSKESLQALAYLVRRAHGLGALGR